MILISLLIALTALPGVAAPSLDRISCLNRKDRTPVEHLICNDPELLRLDGMLGETYTAKMALNTVAGKQALVDSELDWLRERMTRCKVPANGSVPLIPQRWSMVPCLVKLYRQRLAGWGVQDTLPAAPTSFSVDFIHPLCIQYALSRTPMRIPLKACNKGYRHINVDIDDRYISAECRDQGIPCTFSYRRIGKLLNGQEAIITSSWTGGTGRWSNLTIIQRTKTGFLSAEQLMAGGDRCSGGISNAELAGANQLEVVQDTDEYAFVAAVDPTIKNGRLDQAVMKWKLGEGGNDCIGTVRTRLNVNSMDKSLLGATITKKASDMRSCFSASFHKTSRVIPLKLSADQARGFVKRVVDCFDSAS